MFEHTTIIVSRISENGIHSHFPVSVALLEVIRQFLERVLTNVAVLLQRALA